MGNLEVTGGRIAGSFFTRRKGAYDKNIEVSTPFIKGTYDYKVDQVKLANESLYISKYTILNSFSGANATDDHIDTYENGKYGNPKKVYYHIENPPSPELRSVLNSMAQEFLYDPNVIEAVEDPAISNEDQEKSKALLNESRQIFRTVLTNHGLIQIFCADNPAICESDPKFNEALNEVSR